MTKLTHTARTILRSRVRRHADNATVLNGRKVSDLSNADLLQAAILLELNVPTSEECTHYEVAKEKGDNPIDRADAYAARSGRGGNGMLRLTGPAQTGAATAGTEADDEKPGPDDAEELDQTTDQTTDQPTDPADQLKADAIKLADEIRGKLGKGDFEGFNRALVDLSIKALTPPPAPAAPTVVIDPSKIAGHIPQVVNRRTARQAGINSTIKINDAATALDVYDYPAAPAIDPDYQWPDASGYIMSKLAGGENVFLWGPAGTGKTAFPMQIAAHFKRPFVSISCHEQTEAGALIGMTVPDPKEGVRWQDGQLLKAIRKPGTVILIDEPTVARPGALAILHNVLAYREIYVEETGERVQVAPGVIFVAADNTNGTGDETGAYEGTRRMNRALLDRFGATIHVDYMTPDRETAVLMAKAGIAKAHAAALVKFANLSRQKANAGGLSHGVGLRRLLSLARDIRNGADPHFAFNAAVLQTAPFDDREPLRQLWTAEINARTFA